MPYDPELAEKMREALAEDPEGVTETKMFGGICWMRHGNMLCGVGTGRYIFRVGQQRWEDALARPGAAVMDFTGRPMRGLVWVEADAAEHAGLATWIELARQFVDSLPPK